jgi:hypothetical protein
MSAQLGDYVGLHLVETYFSILYGKKMDIYLMSGSSLIRQHKDTFHVKWNIVKNTQNYTIRQ